MVARMRCRANDHGAAPSDACRLNYSSRMSAPMRGGWNGSVLCTHRLWLRRTRPVSSAAQPQPPQPPRPPRMTLCEQQRRQSRRTQRRSAPPRVLRKPAGGPLDWSLCCTATRPETGPRCRLSSWPGRVGRLRPDVVSSSWPHQQTWPVGKQPPPFCSPLLPSTVRLDDTRMP